MKGNYKHGHNTNRSPSPEYICWQRMKSRCNNKKSPDYYNYGAIGVKVCDRWMNSFENFLNDMGTRPSAHHSLDRFPNNKGNYEPGNCRWATHNEQQSNRTNNKWIEYNGRIMIQAEWARFFGLRASSFQKMLKTQSMYYIQKKIEQKAKQKLKQ